MLIFFPLMNALVYDDNDQGALFVQKIKALAKNEKPHLRAYFGYHTSLVKPSKRASQCGKTK